MTKDHKRSNNWLDIQTIKYINIHLIYNMYFYMSTYILQTLSR